MANIKVITFLGDKNFYLICEFILLYINLRSVLNMFYKKL